MNQAIQDQALVKSAEEGASEGDAPHRSGTVPESPRPEPERTPARRSAVQVGVEDKGLQRIRARSSYRLFRELYEFLRNKPDGTAVLRKFYEVLDSRGGFGSRANATYAAESLGQVLKDVGGMHERPDSEVL